MPLQVTVVVRVLMLAPLPPIRPMLCLDSSILFWRKPDWPHLGQLAGLAFPQGLAGSRSGR